MGNHSIDHDLKEVAMGIGVIPLLQSHKDFLSHAL